MSSPAALFLSAFAASSTSADEEATVAGYTLGDVVGYGATSTIRKAYNDADSITAVKIIRISDLVKKAKPSNKALAKVRRALLHEESIWASLSHEHILPLFTAHHTPTAFYFFTLYCPAGSLFDILKRDGTPALLQDDAGMMFRQVVRGLRYLHEEAKLVHRDIKLENVLVDEMGLCKIADFGTAKPISHNFYQRSSPASVAVSRSQSRSVSRSRPCDDVEELSEPDLEKDWVDGSHPSSPGTPNTPSSMSSSTSTSDDELASQSYNVHRASSLTSPRPSHLNRFHRNSTTSYTHSLSHSHTLPPSSSYPTTTSDANFRNHNNTKPKSKSASNPAHCPMPLRNFFSCHTRWRRPFLRSRSMVMRQVIGTRAEAEARVPTETGIVTTLEGPMLRKAPTTTTITTATSPIQAKTSGHSASFSTPF